MAGAAGAAVVVAAVICAVLTYPLTRLRGHYFAIATVAIWMIAQPIGATWEFIGGSQGLFIPVKPRAGVVSSALSLQFSGPTKAMGYYYACLVLFAMTLALMALVERSKLGLLLPRDPGRPGGGGGDRHRQPALQGDRA